MYILELMGGRGGEKEKGVKGGEWQGRWEGKVGRQEKRDDVMRKGESWVGSGNARKKWGETWEVQGREGKGRGDWWWRGRTLSQLTVSFAHTSFNHSLPALAGAFPSYCFRLCASTLFSSPLTLLRILRLSKKIADSWFLQIVRRKPIVYLGVSFVEQSGRHSSLT